MRVVYGVLLLLMLSGCGKNEVGDVSLGVFTTKDIKLDAINLDFSDPSDSSIACRQTGPITAEMIAKIDKSKNGEVLFSKSKSIFFKSMKIRRIYDTENQTLMYLSYSTKETSGSFKHSLSTVPLWGTDAYSAATSQQN